MSAPKNTLRYRITDVLRRTSFVCAAVVGTAGLVSLGLPSPYNWSLIVIAVAGSTGVAYWLAGDTADRSLSDFHHVLGEIISFAGGNKAVRARAAGARDVRQLADAFNKVAHENEVSLKQISSEDKRQSQFVSDVSHEIRTPLTAIRGNAELLLTGDVEPEDTVRFLTTIASEAERLGRLANDLLTLQRIEGATGELKLRSFNPRDAVDLAATSLEALFELRGVAFDIVGEGPNILGERDRIQQVVVNLVDNATRMVNEGGKVWVELSEAERGDIDKRAISERTFDSDHFTCIAICDNGPGIPEENIPRLFERFFRTDTSRARNSGGAGLGLSIVKAIIDIHGGAIEAQNRIGGGMQFSVFLPIPPEYDSEEVDTKWAGFKD